MTSKSELKRLEILKRPDVAWICRDCVIELGGRFREVGISTFHSGMCGVCKQVKSVTEPRDFIWAK